MNIFNLNFMHPQYGTIFNADVDIAFTGEEMLRNLVLSGFIPERKEGYRLALMNEVMQSKQPLAVLEGLEDGSVLRIMPVQNTAGEETLAQLEPLSLYVQHPRSGEYAPIDCSPELTVQELLDLLVERGFLLAQTDLSVAYKGEQLQADTNLETLALEDGAYLQIREANAKPADDVLRTVLLGLDSFQASTNDKLQEILDYLPPPSAIPIDPDRAINPTAEVYESIDTIINEIRTEAGLEPIQKVRIWSPIPLIVWGSLGVILLTLFGLWMRGVI